MDNSEKIFEKIKQASFHEEDRKFPAMEKVWSRVETKLDQKVLTRQNKQWKKIAIAASFLLIFTISLQIFKPETKTDSTPLPPASEKNKMETTTAVKDKKIAIPEKQANELQKEPEKIVKPQSAIAPNALPLPKVAEMSDQINKESESVSEHDDLQKNADNEDQKEQKDFQKGKAFQARSVVSSADTSTAFEENKKAANAAPTVSQKSAPLVVVDGKPITGKSDKEAFKEGLAKVSPDEIDNIVILKEPLYIINGTYYSEQELFGPNPTSPYHPLSQQQIETLSILQGEKAIAAYGKKGEKGVVIITTKNGKPVKKTVRKDE